MLLFRTFLLAECFITLCLQSAAQQQIIINNDADLASALDSIIPTFYLEDSNKVADLYFIIKVDSLGEIHSAHIWKYENMAIKKRIALCRDIEDKFKAVYIYNRYQEMREKYVYATFPVRINRTDNNILNE